MNSLVHDLKYAIAMMKLKKKCRFYFYFCEVKFSNNSTKIKSLDESSHNTLPFDI